MIELDNRTSLLFDTALLDSIAAKLSDKEIELIITTNDEIQEINKQTRGIDKSTDVLSFPYEEMPMSPLGSIMISAEHVEQKAQELGHTNTDEIALLFIHGMLHLLGFDHEVDSGEMRQEEERLIKAFDLPESLIIRTQG
ncbi:MAG: rRNA maturation RNase YbeY [Helicobacteraceae bacterium]|nr:rRNA maturation RNase YbeY [Helicobacteraceae bacterium]